MFDEGWVLVYSNAYPSFKKYNYKGSIPIIPTLVREKEYLSYEQIGKLYMDGWDILNHSYSHKEDIDSIELFNEFEKSKNWMAKRYLTKCKEMAVIPYGYCDPYLIKLMLDSKYDNVRTSDNSIILDSENTVYYPITTISLKTDMEIKEELYLSDAYKQKKSIAFIIHKLDKASDQYQTTYDPNRLEEILEFIHKNEDKFQVLPYSDMFN